MQRCLTSTVAGSTTLHLTSCTKTEHYALRVDSIPHKGRTAAASTSRRRVLYSTRACSTGKNSSWELKTEANAASTVHACCPAMPCPLAGTTAQGRYKPVPTRSQASRSSSSFHTVPPAGPWIATQGFRSSNTQSRHRCTSCAAPATATPTQAARQGQGKRGHRATPPLRYTLSHTRTRRSR